MEVASASVEAWRAGGNQRFLGEGDRYLGRLSAISRAAKISGPRVHDARVAAISLYHGVSELWTADRDFSLFPELKTHYPLAG